MAPKDSKLIDSILTWFWWCSRSVSMTQEEYLNHCIETEGDSPDVCLRKAIAEYLLKQEDESSSLGDNFIHLGHLLNEPSSTLEEIVGAAHGMGLNLEFRLVGNEE